MITGAIAVFILVVCVLPASSNGEGGAAILGIAIAVILLLFGLVSRADDRAHVNRMNYWSHDGKDRAMMRRQWNREAREEDERRRLRNVKTYDQIQEERGYTKVRGRWTAGKVERLNSTHPCPACGWVMNEDHRIQYSSGAVFVTYRCGRCRKELPVKIK